MAQNLPKTGYNDDSSQNFVVGAGIVVHDFTFDSGSNEYKWEEFGATTGGNSLKLNTTLRQMEIDGILSTPMGADMIEETEGTIELNLLEHTLENIRKVLLADEVVSDGNDGFETGTAYVRPTDVVQNKHYLKDFAHISPLSNGDSLVIKFDYAICTEGLEMEPQDGEDNAMSATFAARTDPANLDRMGLPVKIARIPGTESPTV